MARPPRARLAGHGSVPCSLCPEPTPTPHPTTVPRSRSSPWVGEVGGYRTGLPLLRIHPWYF